MKPLLIALLLLPLTLAAQVARINDTVKIHKGAGEHGTYRTIYRQKTLMQADHAIDHANAIVLSSVKSVNPELPVDTLSLRINNDTFFAILPYALVLHELTLDKEQDYIFQLTLEQLNGSKDDLMAKASAWLKHEYRNDKDFRIYPDDTTGKFLASGNLQVNAGGNRYNVYHQLMVETTDAKAKIWIGNFMLYSYDAPGKTVVLSQLSPPKGISRLGAEEWEELRDRTAQVMNMMLYLFSEKMRTGN